MGDFRNAICHRCEKEFRRKANLICLPAM